MSDFSSIACVAWLVCVASLCDVFYQLFMYVFMVLYDPGNMLSSHLSSSHQYVKWQVWSREKEAYAWGMARQRWGEGHLGTTCLFASVWAREADRAEKCATRLRHQPTRWLKQRVQSMPPGQKIPLPANRHFSSKTADIISLLFWFRAQKTYSVVLWWILVVGWWEVCLCFSSYWVRTIGRRNGSVWYRVWLSPSVHSDGSCAVISLRALSVTVTEQRPGRIHMTLSENEDGSITGQRSLEEVERCDYIQNGIDFFEMIEIHITLLKWICE